jgi:hypothetical protein
MGIGKTFHGFMICRALALTLLLWATSHAQTNTQRCFHVYGVPKSGELCFVGLFTLLLQTTTRRWEILKLCFLFLVHCLLPTCIGTTWLTMLSEKLYKMNCQIIQSNGERCRKCEDVSKSKHLPSPSRIRGRGDDASLIIFRDTRDVIVSHFHWAPHGIKNIKNFVFNTTVGAMEVIRQQNEWASLVRWLNPMKQDFLVMYYEDLLANTFKGASDIARVIGLNLSKEAIEKAIQASSFDAMRTKEETGKLALKKHPESAQKLQKSSDKPPEQLFGVMTRKGEAGGYVDELDRDTIKYIEKLMKSKLDGGLARRYLGRSRNSHS